MKIDYLLDNALRKTNAFQLGMPFAQLRTIDGVDMQVLAFAVLQWLALEEVRDRFPNRGDALEYLESVCRNAGYDESIAEMVLDFLINENGGLAGREYDQLQRDGSTTKRKVKLLQYKRVYGRNNILRTTEQGKQVIHTQWREALPIEDDILAKIVTDLTESREYDKAIDILHQLIANATNNISFLRNRHMDVLNNVGSLEIARYQRDVSERLMYAQKAADKLRSIRDTDINVDVTDTDNIIHVFRETVMQAWILQNDLAERLMVCYRGIDSRITSHMRSITYTERLGDPIKDFFAPLMQLEVKSEKNSDVWKLLTSFLQTYQYNESHNRYPLWAMDMVTLMGRSVREKREEEPIEIREPFVDSPELKALMQEAPEKLKGYLLELGEFSHLDALAIEGVSDKQRRVILQLLTLAFGAKELFKEITWQADINGDVNDYRFAGDNVVMKLTQQLKQSENS